MSVSELSSVVRSIFHRQVDILLQFGGPENSLVAVSIGTKS